MKSIIFLCLIALFILPSYGRAQNENTFTQDSVILEVEGHACMGDERSRKDTRLMAITETKRKAAEMALTHISSETTMKDYTVSSDIVDAYSQAKVKIIEEIEATWFTDQFAGECYRTKLKVEVIPDPTALSKSIKKEALIEEPNAPLTVRLWTDKNNYRVNEKIKIYLRGNKPFYARIVYQDAKGNLIQLIPNPYRSDNYFNGGVTYEIPSGNDRFDLQVSPPLGEEKILLYTATSDLGKLDLQQAGSVYVVQDSSKGVEQKTRGVAITQKTGASSPNVSEFSEANVTVTTMK
ncbi:MAG: DUF4384 domain-containing protein [Deltaproteobacteria bacterium]|nr:DUF4384 domain-containing protein [Deltaproteobacteria bacterium]